MKDFEKRLEKLEQALVPVDPTIVVLDWRVGNALGVALTRVSEDRFGVLPLEEESSELLVSRAIGLAKEYVKAHRDIRQDYIALHVERDWGGLK